jgi:beta-lactamase class A
MNTMFDCRTGSRRIKSGLPVWVRAGNKTGTLGGTVNDLAVVELPEGRGHMVLAVFVGRASAPFRQREAVIGELSRTAYDLFVAEFAPATDAPMTPIVALPAFNNALAAVE